MKTTVTPSIWTMTHSAIGDAAAWGVDPLCRIWLRGTWGLPEPG